MRGLLLALMIPLMLGCSSSMARRDSEMAAYSHGYVDGVRAAHSGARVVSYPPGK